jgi:hypothetical protein
MHPMRFRVRVTGASALLLGVAASAVHVPVGSAEEARHHILIIEGGRRCEDLKVRDVQPFRAAARQLHQSIERLVPGARPQLLTDPSARKVQGTLASLAGTLWLVYVGHGALQGMDGPSTLCLDQGRLTAEDLVKAIPQTIRAASLLLDACSSANVRLPHTRTHLSVLSADADRINTSARGTILSEALSNLLARLAADPKRAHITDHDLIGPLAAEVVEPARLKEMGWTRPPKPKLQSRSPVGIPVLYLGPGAKELPTATNGSREIVTPAGGRLKQVRFLGPIGSARIGQLEQAGFVQRPCLEPTGTCYVGQGSPPPSPWR